MEENKNIEIEQNDNNEETAVEKQTLEPNSFEQKEEIEEIDSEFLNIDKDVMKKNYIIVGILYFIVVILSILLIIGIKNQKDTIKDKIDNDNKINEKLEEETNDEFVVPEETPKEEPQKENIIPETNDDLNILDQI